jgi:hypothetical protein
MARTELAGWLTHSRRRAYIALALFVLAGLPLYLGFKSALRGPAEELLPFNSQAPVLEGPTLAGSDFNSNSLLYGGRVLVYVFIDPRFETASRLGAVIRRWNERWADGRALVIPVLIGANDKLQQDWAARFGVKLTRVVIDRAGKLCARFLVLDPPVIYVVDGTGKVRFAAQAAEMSDDRKLAATVEKYLALPTRRFDRSPP